MVQLNGISEFYEKFAPILRDAEEVTCRGYKTKELTGVNFCIENPRKRLMWMHKRMFNLPFAITESLMLFQKNNKAKYITKFNDNVIQFSDDGETFYGSYGYRIAEFIPQVIEKLKEDPTTRQAILTINRVEDNFVKTKDIPCTISMQFLVRNGMLDLHVNMRSNDAIWGTPYDVFNFTMLQEVVANSLDIELGCYYHNAASLHVYEWHYDLLDEIIDNLDRGRYSSAETYLHADYETYKRMSDMYVETLDSGKDLGNCLKFDDEQWPLNVLAVCEGRYEKIIDAVLPLELRFFVKDYFKLTARKKA